MNEILEHLQGKKDEMIKILQELVEVESPSEDKDANDQIGQKVRSLFEELTGGRTSTIRNDKYGDHIRGEWGEGDEQILLLAHFDTVWPKGTIIDIPFSVENGKVYGPGVFDMKGGLVQGIFALHALTTMEKKSKCKVVFLFTSDEEISSPTSRELIEEEAKKSKYVFVLEPAMSKEGAIKTFRKGVGKFKLMVEGKSAHAGIDPQKGASAIEEIAKQVTYLHSLNDFDKGTTVNVGKIEGGTTTNVIAAEAQAEIDLRVKTNKEFDRIVPLIKNISTDTDGVKVKVTGGVRRPPFERTEEVIDLFDQAKFIADKHLNMNLMEKGTGGGSDGNFTAQYAPTLDGLGAVGDGAHANHEHLIIEEMPKRSALIALLLLHL